MSDLNKWNSAAKAAFDNLIQSRKFENGYKNKVIFYFIFFIRVDKL